MKLVKFFHDGNIIVAARRVPWTKEEMDELYLCFGEEIRNKQNVNETKVYREMKRHRSKIQILKRRKWETIKKKINYLITKKWS